MGSSGVKISQLAGKSRYRAKRERTQRIWEPADDDAFIKAITIPGDPQTQALIDKLSTEKAGAIQTDAERLAGIKIQNEKLREEHDEALANQTTGGRIGGFLGIMVGVLSDPITLGILPLCASWATGILKTALIGGG